MTTGEEVWKEKKHKRKEENRGTVTKLDSNGGCQEPLCPSEATLIGKKQLKLHKQYSQKMCNRFLAICNQRAETCYPSCPLRRQTRLPPAHSSAVSL